LKINSDKSIFDINYEDLEIVDYESHPAIKAPIAV
ncbi:TPA: thymidylate synthase, partial [Staphylococcus aureus]|nr:thymidylate synthase [Staphylococcus aureus]HCW8952463.1 thymidylate synthase [Staphylococcus aureus]HCZ0855018.1 thymidylate synthase [Staphylococcus aureus]HCZ1828562.1 thymidylate synthase [Staphylococcus aureus]HCZ2997381.1 thymidylate synthase [Staphylococcus aureus]